MFLEIGVTAVVGVAVSMSGYVGKKVFDLDKKHAAHEASDTATFHAFAESLRDTKEGVKEGNEKLDRLIQFMLENPTGPATKKRSKR